MMLTGFTIENAQEGWRLDGIEEGIEIGTEKGIRQKQIEDAVGCLKAGIPDHLISAALNLSFEEIEEIRNCYL